MIANELIAAQVKVALVESFRILDDSAAIVRQHSTDTEVADYLNRLGPILYEIAEKLMDPLNHQHPDLRPANWDFIPESRQEISHPVKRGTYVHRNARPTNPD